MGRLKRDTKTGVKYAAFFLAGIFSIYVVAFAYGNVTQALYTCKGIENFYSGEGFVADYRDLFNNANIAAGGVPPKSPLAIWQNESVDCDTMSPAIMCLSELYNDTECAYYMQIVVDQTDEPTPSHLGIKCRYFLERDRYGPKWSNWQTYY